jgi:hypothetical protein
LIGIIVVLRNAPVNKYHNALHMVTGVVALAVAFLGSRSAARTFCVGFGAFYTLFSVMGFVLGDRTMQYAWHLGPLHLNLGDHLFHLVLGSVLLAIGLFTRRTMAVAPLSV